MRKYNADAVHRSKGCGHGWCTDCMTRRGRNRGNRNARHAARTLLASAAIDTGADAGDDRRERDIPGTISRTVWLELGCPDLITYQA